MQRIGAEESTTDDGPLWIEVDEGHAIEVYEFVPTNDPAAEEFIDEFRSDKDRGKPAYGREARHPELHDSISAFRTLAQARLRWEQIAERVGAERVRLGPWVARVRLEPGNAFRYDDTPDPTGHLYLQGDPLKLVQAVVEIVYVRAELES